MCLNHFQSPARESPRRGLASWSLVFLCACGCSLARAGAPPVLEFDVPFTVRCRPLALRGPEKSSPGVDFFQFMAALSGPSHSAEEVDRDRELIEVVIPVSTRVRDGSEKDVKQCLYTLVDPGMPPTLSVTDWLPRTELKTEYAKPIQYSRENLANIGISMTAKYVVSATGQASDQLKSGVNYEMLPPQETVLASGTIQHGHGIFFKLRSSTQTTLEGEKSFSAIFSVPRGWRGGCLRLECEAVGVRRGIMSLLDREVNNGPAVFYVGLYRADDAEAEHLAADLARRQQELFDCLAGQQNGDKAAWYRFFAVAGPEAWCRPRGQPAGAAPAATCEATLLREVADGTARSVSTEEVPAPVREKLRALKQATEALQALSVGRPAARELTKSSGGPVPSLTPLEDLLPAAGLFAPTPPAVKANDTERRPPPGENAPRPNAPAAATRTLAANQAMVIPMPVPAPPDVPAGNREGKDAGPKAATVPHPDVPASAGPTQTASDGVSKAAAPDPSPAVSSAPGRPWRGSPGRISYLLGGACTALIVYAVISRAPQLARKQTKASRVRRPQVRHVSRPRPADRLPGLPLVRHDDIGAGCEPSRPGVLRDDRRAG
jgi:hypothetical protein